MEQKHMFTNKMIADLLIPVVLEQHFTTSQ